MDHRPIFRYLQRWYPIWYCGNMDTMTMMLFPTHMIYQVREVFVVSSGNISVLQQPKA
jgi:hypothetical protein